MIIHAVIMTPQHKYGRVFDYTIQRGYLDDETLYFVGEVRLEGTVGNHDVQFRSIEDFKKACDMVPNKYR